MTAHGRDVRNIGAIPGVAAATRFTVRRASTVIAVSDYLRRELEAKVPDARGKTEVVDSGVDLERFPVLPAPERTPRVPLYRLAHRAQERRPPGARVRALRGGELTFVGDGPLRPQLEGRERVHVVGAGAARRDPGVPRPRERRLPAEPAGAARPVAARGDGDGPLGRRDPGRRAARVRPGGSRRARRPARRAVDRGRLSRGAAALPIPNPAAREAAEAHDLKLQAGRVEAILERAARGRPA